MPEKAQQSSLAKGQRPTAGRASAGSPARTNYHVQQHMPNRLAGPGQSKPAAQPKANNTGLPGGLVNKMEKVFKTDMSHLDVRVNSKEPAKVDAIATAQGNRVDIAPGHYNPNTSKGQSLIAHEAWHTIQQAQGRVKPTMQAKGKAINNDRGLEAEADRMGARVAHA